MKPFSQRPTEGSALLLAVITMVVISAIIAATLPLALNNNRLVVRETLSATAFNFAESGIERAIYDLRSNPTVAELETAGWELTENGHYLTRTIGSAETPNYFPDGWLSDTHPFRIRVVMENPLNADTIHIVSEAQVFPSMGAPVRKVVDLEISVVRSEGSTESAGGGKPFKGVVATGIGQGSGTWTIDFNGQPTFRSYDSRHSGEGTYTPPIMEVNNGEMITIGAIGGKIDMKHANVYGIAATSATEAEALSGNLINRHKHNETPTRGFAYEYAMNFDEVTPPIAPATSGVPFSHDQNTSPASLGTPGATEPTVYKASQNINLSQNLLIDGPVIIIAQQNINFNNRKITVSPTGSLTFFSNSQFQLNNSELTVNGTATIVAKGDVNAKEIHVGSTGNLKIYVGGGGQFGGDLNRDGRPQNLMIYGSQNDITFGGNNNFSGLIYAPRAHVMNNGKGTFHGAIVGSKVTFNGSPGDFWFDEALLELTTDGSSSEEGSSVASFAVDKMERYYIPTSPAEEFLTMSGQTTAYYALINENVPVQE